MKIAQIVCVYPPYKGGIATSAENFARVLKSAGHEVKTFTIDYEKKSPLERGGRQAGVCKDGLVENVIRLKTFPGRGKGGVLPFLCWRLKDFDLVYLHYPFFGTAEIIWFLKKFVWRKKKKLVIQYHMDTALPNLLLKILSLPSVLIFNSLFKEADLIVSASLDYVKDSKLKNIYAEHPEKFVEIPFGVDTERFKPAEVSRDEASFKILFVGGLDRAHYFKGVEVLLAALKLLDKDSYNCRLVIVGDGDLRSQYENKARELGIADKVNFVGHVSDQDLPKKYQEADCFVLPSINKSEAFGIVLIEAMASGLPVIATDLPGVRGVFENNKQGLLLKTGDVTGLADKIKYLLDNYEIRAKMAIEARKSAEEKYDQDKVGKKIIGVISDIKD